MHYENPSNVQTCLAPVRIYVQNMPIMSVNQRPNFCFGRLQIQESVVSVESSDTKSDTRICFCHPF